MADEYTKNLSLKKPAYESAADIRDINDNMDKLDESIGNLISGGGSGGSETADRLTTPRQISLSGDASGSAMFDGSSDIDIKVTIPSLSEEELLELLQGSSGGGGGGGSGGSGGIGTVTATVDDTSGNPQVKVTQSGSDFRLDFTGINGAKGADGAPGKDGQPGPAGSNGQDGAAAGFGEITATVDAYSGTPSVEVTADGPDTKKAFHFAFHNLKGQDGSGGGSGGGIGTVTATVDHTSGNPQVKVSQSGSDFRLDFTGINGEDGAPGERGQAGQAGQDGTTFTPSVDGEGNLSWTNDGNKENPETINIRGPKGEPGKDGAAGEPGEKGADATVETEEITIQPSQWQGDAAAGYTVSAACTIATPDNALFCAPRISSKQEYDQFSAAGMAVTGQSQGAVTLACYAGKPEKAVSIFVMAAVVKGA